TSATMLLGSSKVFPSSAIAMALMAVSSCAAIVLILRSGSPSMRGCRAGDQMLRQPGGQLLGGSFIADGAGRLGADRHAVAGAPPRRLRPDHPPSPVNGHAAAGAIVAHAAEDDGAAARAETTRDLAHQLIDGRHVELGRSGRLQPQAAVGLDAQSLLHRRDVDPATLQRVTVTGGADREGAGAA